MNIDNSMGITEIYFEKEVQAYCPLGKDFYTAELCVTFTPDEKIMDYCETDNFIKGLSGKSLIIEDLVEKVYEHIQDEIYPAHLQVTAKAKSNSHFYVEVTKE